MPAHLNSVQYLRAIAAMMVVLFHMGVPLQRLGYEGSWPDWPARGIDIFFVISGLIMWVVTADRNVRLRDFFYRRVVRIVPIYWLLTSFIVGLLLLAPALVQSGRFEVWHVVASYLFLPASHPVIDMVAPALIPGWTLNYEMFFYAIFGLSLLLPPGQRLPAICGVLALLVALGEIMRPGGVMLAFYTSPIILEFGFGVALGAALGRGWAMPPWLAWPTIGLGFVALAMGDEAWAHRVIVAGLPSLAIVAGVVSLEVAGKVPSLRVPNLLGDASYALYLTHTIVLSAMGQVAYRLGLGGLPGGLVIFVLLACVATQLASLAIHMAFERPLNRRLLRLGRDMGSARTLRVAA
ncbi:MULTISPECIES: acyltransferase family protein [Roseomonadaceae]|uniref:Acyltransferase n=1 Tax=Falsiroseomonas oleicola TaxID=2801474 RepID=A0ABS6H8U7_9PROT|nr:acyltransferase [Roseomonas oleicola]MBU8543760.1 acyltransferase [Roseomonas oleicola]